MDLDSARYSWWESLILGVAAESTLTTFESRQTMILTRDVDVNVEDLSGYDLAIEGVRWAPLGGDMCLTAWDSTWSRPRVLP